MFRHLMTSMAIAALAATAFAQQQERDQIPVKYTWDLTQIYASDEAWRAAKEQFAAKMPKGGEFKGTLAQSPQQLAVALDTIFALNKELSRLYVYTSLKSDQDTRVQKYQAMQQEM